MSPSKTEKYVLSLIKSSMEPVEQINKLIEKLKKKDYKNFWGKISKLDFEKDIISLESWLKDVLIQEPPEKDIIALWFGLFNAARKNKETLQLYVAGSKRYTKDDFAGDWAINPEYFPDRRYAKSHILDKIYSYSYEANGPKVDGEYFGLWYSAITIAFILQKNAELYSFDAPNLTIVVGFDEGDYITIGTLKNHKFVPGKYRKISVATLKPTITKGKYYYIQSVMPGSWLLDVPIFPSGPELVAGFACICKYLQVKEQMISKIYFDVEGNPVDYSTDAFGNPIVSKKFADVFDLFAENHIQRIPLTIQNYHQENYEVLNVLAEKDCLDYDSSEFLMKNYAKNFVLIESKIDELNVFRLVGEIAPNVIFIKSDIKEELEKNKFTGLKLFPVDLR